MDSCLQLPSQPPKGPLKPSKEHVHNTDLSQGCEEPPKGTLERVKGPLEPSHY